MKVIFLDIDGVLNVIEQAMIYNWFRGDSGFKTPIPFWNENNFEWKYR